jgi:peptidyl-prolyl cis-trans isomerase SurA
VAQRANLLLVSAGIDAPTDELRQRARSQALRDLVDERLQLQEAKNFKVEIKPEEVDQRLADIARQNNTTSDGFVASLRASGVDISTLRAQIQAEMAWNRLMSGLYGSRLRVSNQEVADTQARLAESATRPQYLLSEIFLAADTEQEFADAQAGAMRLLEQMQRGAPFPLVARQFSAAPSAAAGGDIGWLPDAEIPPELQPVVRQLQPGQVSLPVRTQTGVYIVALRDQRPGQPAGANSRVTLRQITAPVASRAALERARRRISGCGGLDQLVASVSGAAVADLGQVSESDLSDTVRNQIAEIEPGSPAPIDVAGDQVAFLVVCARESAGPGVPTRREIEDRLFDQELAMLSDRYLRNLRREATILTR